MDWTGAVGQVRDRIEFQLDVIEFFACFFQVLIQLEIDHGKTGARNGFDFGNLRVRRDLFFQLFGDKLLDLLGTGARPGHQRHSRAHLDLWILAVRHMQIGVNAPEASADEQYPTDMTLLDEESRRVALAANLFLVGFALSHGYLSNPSSLFLTGPLTLARHRRPG